MATRITVEEVKGGRFRFVAYTAGRANRSLRTWATKRAALAAGRREYRV